MHTNTSRCLFALSLFVFFLSVGGWEALAAMSAPPTDLVVISDEGGTDGEILDLPYRKLLEASSGSSKDFKTLNKQEQNSDLLRRFFEKEAEEVITETRSTTSTSKSFKFLSLESETLSGGGDDGSSAAVNGAEGDPLFRLLTIPVHFTLAPTPWQGSQALSFFDNLIFGTAFGTVNHYYRDVTEDRLDMVSNTGFCRADNGNYPEDQCPTNIGWIDMVSPYSYYADGGMASSNNSQDLVENLIPVLEAQGIDFSNYDNDGNGFVDSIVIIVAGPGGDLNAGYFKAHTWNTREPIMTASGKRVSTYSIVPEAWGKSGATITRDVTLGVYAHEIGHIFGLVDLYDRDDSSFGIGTWGLMGSGAWNGIPDANGSMWGDVPAYFGASSKVQLGLIDPTYIVGGGHTGLTLPNTSEPSGVIYHLQTQNGEYFLAENRQRIGYDQYLPGDGLLIWHIDESRDSNDIEFDPDNPTAGHYQVALEQADGDFDLEDVDNDGNTGDDADPFPGSLGNRIFNLSGAPNSDTYDGTDTGTAIINISDSASVMTADFVGRDVTVLSPLEGQKVGGEIAIKIASIHTGSGYTAELEATYQFNSVTYTDSGTANSSCAAVEGSGCLAELVIDTMNGDGDPRIDNGPGKFTISGPGLGSGKIVNVAVRNFSNLQASTTFDFDENNNPVMTDDLSWMRSEDNLNGTVRITMQTAGGPEILATRLNTCHSGELCARAVRGNWWLNQKLDHTKLLPTESYKLSYWTRAGSGVYGTRITICSAEDVCDEPGETDCGWCGAKTSSCSKLPPANGSWVEQECTFTPKVPITAATLNVLIGTDGYVAEHYNYVDQLSIVRLSDSHELVGNGDFQNDLDPMCTGDAMECWRDWNDAVGDGQLTSFQWPDMPTVGGARCYMVEDIFADESTQYLGVECTALERPGRASNLTASGGHNRIYLSWHAGDRAESYRIRWGMKNFVDMDSAATYYTFNTTSTPGMNNNVTYSFKVLARNAAGTATGSNGGYSNSDSAMATDPPPPCIPKLANGWPCTQSVVAIGVDDMTN